MTDAEQGAALLRAILDEPDDDAARLVYADWLSDDGQEERAEFVRLQAEIERLAAASGHPKTTPLAWSCMCNVCESAKPLRRRERRLLVESRYAWTVGLFPAPPAPVADRRWVQDNNLTVAVSNGCVAGELTFRRGFVEYVRCTLDAWREHGPQIVEAHPVTRVELTDKEPMRDGYKWRWYKGYASSTLARPLLPAWLFDILPPGDDAGESAWTDRDAALDALSAALIAWAKLPPEERG